MDLQVGLAGACRDGNMTCGLLFIGHRRYVKDGHWISDGWFLYWKTMKHSPQKRQLMPRNLENDNTLTNLFSDDQ